MTIYDIMQKTLDGALLPDGVLSHHLRRVKADVINDSNIPVNNDEYVVYRLVSSTDGTHGDGKAQIKRQYIDVNYYYSYEKTDARTKDAAQRVADIKAAVLSNPHFRLANGESDLPDIDANYRGINMEFLYIGVIDNA